MGYLSKRGLMTKRIRSKLISILDADFLPSVLGIVIAGPHVLKKTALKNENESLYKMFPDFIQIGVCQL